MAFLSAKQLNTIRGKMLLVCPVGHDIWKVFDHIDTMEEHLDESDCEDTFGPEGWRKYFGIPD